MFMIPEGRVPRESEFDSSRSSVLEYQLLLMERTTSIEQLLSTMNKSLTHVNDSISILLQNAGFDHKPKQSLQNGGGDSGEHAAMNIATTQPSIAGEWTYGQIYSYRISQEGASLVFTEHVEEGLLQGDIFRGPDGFEGNLFFQDTLMPQGRIRLRLENNQLISNFQLLRSSTWSQDIIATKKGAPPTFEIGQLVERRQLEWDWGKGFVTSTSPLKVTASARNPRGHSRVWDEVRAINTEVDVDINVQHFSKATAEQRKTQLPSLAIVRHGMAVTNISTASVPGIHHAAKPRNESATMLMNRQINASHDVTNVGQALGVSRTNLQVGVDFCTPPETPTSTCPADIQISDVDNTPQMRTLIDRKRKQEVEHALGISHGNLHAGAGVFTPPETSEIVNRSSTRSLADKKRRQKISMAADRGLDHSIINSKEEANFRSVFGEEDDHSKPPYHVEDLYAKEGWCSELARNPTFANFTVLVVVLNSIYLGVDADYNTEPNLYDAEWPFQLCTELFCFYFTFELGVRFFAFAKRSDCLKDGWFRFDLFLVVTMLLDAWVLSIVLKFSPSNHTAKIPTQPLRILRLLKLTRVKVLMESFPELITMLQGLVRAIRGIFAAMLLLGLMAYTWSIIIHMLLVDDHEYNQFLREHYGYEFKSIGNCIWALVIAGTFMLDNAAPLMYDLLTSEGFFKRLAGSLFVFYSFLSALLLLQMLIAVLCDIVIQVANERRAAEGIRLIRHELMEDLRTVTGGSNDISASQFEQVMETERSKVLLRTLNINRQFLFQVVPLLFKDDDSTIEISSLLELMVACRGHNSATVQVLASVLCVFSNALCEMEDDIIDMISGDAGA